MNPSSWPELPSEQLPSGGRLYRSLGLISLLNLIYGLFSHLFKSKLFLSEALVAVLLGIACGPKGLDLLFTEFSGVSSAQQSGNLLDLATMFLHASRLVMAIQVMAAGVSLPRAYLFRHWQSLAILWGPVMLGMWLISSLIFLLIFGSILTPLEAFLMGACVTPTDPVLANSIIRGRFADEHVPVHVRTLLSAESGANDGAGLPLLFLPLLLLRGASSSEAARQWLFHVWLYQILFSVIIGAIVGFIARKALQFCEYRGFIDKESFLVFNLALALAMTGLVTMIGSNDLLAVFVAGAVFAWDDWFSEATREAHILEVVDSLFNLTYFVFLGTAVPWDLFPSLSIWRLILSSLLILFLRRLPLILLIRPLIPELKSRREAVFTGWFGPMGVGAIFYASLATIDWHNASILPIVWFQVLASILAHGVTVPLFHLSLTRSLSLSWGDTPRHYDAVHAPQITLSTMNLAPPSVEEDLSAMAKAIEEAQTAPIGTASPTLSA